MKLSEAIRIGAARTKPARGSLAYETSDGWRACALGCALVAVDGEKKTRELELSHGKHNGSLAYDRLIELFPALDAKWGVGALEGTNGETYTDGLLYRQVYLTNDRRFDAFNAASKDVRIYVAEILEALGL
jgi:hypothetical protein